jgi:hypothetical protein
MSHDPELKFGMKHSDVRLVQAALNQYFANRREPLAVDGIFGSQTLEAVNQFQTEHPGTGKRNSNEPDGIVGRRTWSALFPFEIHETTLLFKNKQVESLSLPSIQLLTQSPQLKLKALPALSGQIAPSIAVLTPKTTKLGLEFNAGLSVSNKKPLVNDAYGIHLKYLVHKQKFSVFGNKDNELSVSTGLKSTLKYVAVQFDDHQLDFSADAYFQVADAQKIFKTEYFELKAVAELALSSKLMKDKELIFAPNLSFFPQIKASYKPTGWLSLNAGAGFNLEGQIGLDRFNRPTIDWKTSLPLKIGVGASFTIPLLKK